MKKMTSFTLWTLVLTVMGMLWVNAHAFGQDETAPVVPQDIINQMQNIREQLRNTPGTEALQAQMLELREQLRADWSNDGLRDQIDELREQIRALHDPALVSQMDALRDQLRELRVAAGGHGGMFIDTDGDGVNDGFQRGMGLRLRQGMSAEGGAKLRERPPLVLGEDGKYLIDANGDGVGDTPLADHLRARWELMDQDGDGMPDPMSRDELMQHLEAMKQWKEDMREMMRQGLQIDIDGDGVIDGRPEPMRRQHGTGGNRDN